MKASIKTKLENLFDRFDEIAALLSQPEVQGDQNKFRALSQEYAQINPLVDCYKKFIVTEETISSAEEMLNEDDTEIRNGQRGDGWGKAATRADWARLTNSAITYTPTTIVIFTWKFVPEQVAMKQPFSLAI